MKTGQLTNACMALLLTLLIPAYLEAQRRGGNRDGRGKQGGNPKKSKSKSQTTIDADQANLDKRVAVYRKGNLPDVLPPWFKECDADGDAQVDLREWHRAGKDLARFNKYDRNRDGFVTVEEMFFHLKIDPKTGATSMPPSGLAVGVLSAKDPRDRIRRSSPHKVHLMRMYRGVKYTINLTASFDTYLRLEDSKRKNLRMDDDGGPGLNSRINFTPPHTDTYRIIATCYSPSRFGKYKLTVRKGS